MLQKDNLEKDCREALSLMRPVRKQFKHDLFSNGAGFTLVECLISLLLLTIVLVGGMAFYFYADQTLTIATHRRMASELANAKLEELKNGGTLPAAGTWSTPENISIGGLTGQRSIFNDGGTNCKEVRVKVNWPEPTQAAANQEIILVTYLK